MLYWPRKFPWLNENQVKWLEEQTATLPSDKKEWAQQELYRKVLPFIIGREFKENRAVLKNEIYNQSLQEQDVYKKNSIQSKLRREDLADLVKEKRNLSPQAPTDQLFNAIVKEADYRGIDRSLINNYLAGKNEDFLYEMELKERPFEDYSKADTLQQGGIKGLATRIAGDWGIWEWVNPVGKLTGMIDDLVQKIPTMSVEDWDKFSREKLWGFGEGMGNVPTMLINAPWSLLKTTSWISRAMTNPLDTAVGLGTLFFSSEGHQALKQRYWDQIQKTATEDPIGLASDILTVISPIAKGLGGATSFIGETGKSWSLVKAGGNITKFWETAGKAGDLWLGIIQENLLWKLSSAIAEKSGWTKWGLKYLQFTQEPLKVAKDYAQHILKVDDLVGLDAKTKQALENNPYAAKWREKTKKRIEDIGISPENKKEVNTEHIQELSDEIIDLIDKKKEGLQDVGGLYQAIKDENVAVDNSLTDLALDRYLEEKGIKIKDGKFDFSDSVIVKDSDMKAIERAYEWATRPEYEATTALNQRKKLDKLAYPEGQPSAGTEVIKGMRELFDKNLKETIPGLKDVDKIYSQKIKEYNEIREGLVYKDSNRKWSIRDNFNQIINTLDWPNRARMLERLEELRPGLGDEIRAVHMMGKLSDLYFKTPKQLHNVATKIGGATLWAVGGFQYGGIGGSIAGAIAGFLTELWVRKFSQKRIQNTIDGLSPDSKVRLEAIEKKIQENKGISPEERQLLDFLGKDIIQKSKVYKENLDKLGAMKLSDFVENGEQKNLPKGKEPTSVDFNKDEPRVEEHGNSSNDLSITKNPENANQSYTKTDGTVVNYKNYTNIEEHWFRRRQFSNKHQLPLPDNLKPKTQLVDLIKIGELEKGTLAKVPEIAFNDWKVRPLELTTEVYEKTFKKHWPFSHENLIATANDWDYLIKDLNGVEGHINLIKELPDGSALLLWAKRKNWAFITTHFEPTKSLKKVLEDAKNNGGEVIERWKNDSSLKLTKKQLNFSETTPLSEKAIVEKYRQKAIKELGLPEWTTEINLAELMGDKKKYAKYQEITAEMQKELWYLWEDGYYTKKWYDDLESRKRKAYGEQKHSLRDDEGLNKLREWAETKKKVLNEWIDSLSMTLRIDKIAKEKWFNKGNHLVKMIDLNKSIKKGSWKRSLQDKEIYKLKDEIILDQVIKRWEPIKDMWDNTTFTVKYKWVFVKWHVWTKVLKKLRKLWLLK